MEEAIRETADFSQEELREAARQIDSTLHKLKETVKTLEAKEHPEQLKSQLTLARRRIAAFGLARALIEEKLQQKN